MDADNNNNSCISFDGCSELEEIYKQILSILPNNIKIISIVHNQFQELYHFQRDIELATIAIYYNAKRYITKIFANEKNPLSNELENILRLIENKKFFNDNATIDESIFEDKSFLLEFYTNIKDTLLENNITIANIENIQFGQKYTFTRDKEYSEMVIWYNAKDQIKSVQFLKQYPKNSNLRSDIQKILSEL